MRLMVAFDLPMVSKRDKRVYTKFRKFLMDDGFIMMQFSVYTRFCRNQADADKHMLLIVGTAIPTGREVDKKFTLVIE